MGFGGRTPVALVVLGEALLVSACSLFTSLDDYAGDPKSETTPDSGATSDDTDAGANANAGADADADASTSGDADAATEGPTSGPRVTSLRLWDVDVKAPVPGYDPLPSSITLSRAAIGRMTIEAIVTSDVNRVVFFVNDVEVHSEVLAPYFITLNSGDNVQPWSPPAGPGPHAIKVLPFVGATTGGTMSVNITFTE